MSEEGINDSLQYEESEFDEPDTEEYFNRERTLKLIELFKKYKPNVAMGSIKTMKRMWEIISVDMTNLYLIPITPQKCENRFKVLERGYKRMTNIVNGGKEPKKLFPYFEEFKNIPHNKKYGFVPGLTYKNYSEYTTVDFNNRVPVSPSPISFIELQNMKHDIEINQELESGKPQTVNQCTPQQVPSNNVRVGVDVYFNRERTLALIDFYKKYYPKYKDRNIKTKRRMWYLIAREMSSMFDAPVTGAKCENKLKVLQRNYTRCSNTKRRCDFEEELKELFEERIAKPAIRKIPILPKLSNITASAPPPPPSNSNSGTPQQVTIRLLDPQKAIAEKVENVLLSIKSDFQSYYKERLNIEREKLSLKRQKFIFMKERAMIEDKTNSSK